MLRTALITGITGQDGSYLAELLLSLGYEVHGVVRPGSSSSRIAHLAGQKLILHPADMTDQPALLRVLDAVRPAEVYHLAACSYVPDSWRSTVATSEVTALGTARLLESIREVDRTIRFCQAGSSQMFGRPDESPQNEATPFRPQSPYAAAKCYAHWLTAAYREEFGIFACGAILYNHESPRRGLQFVTRKITSTAARIRLGQAEKLVLGNLDARRDWGFAGDYVRALWLMLQHDRADDYVIGTGRTHSVRELLELAFSHLGLDYRAYVSRDAALARRSDGAILVGDASKARRILNWQPEVDFAELVRMMVEADLRTCRSAH